MGRRLELQALLKTLAPNVYFQAPPSVGMKYPAVLYMLDYANTEFADNNPYRHTKRYQVTVIDVDPDSEIPDKVAALPMCTFSRHFRSDNLNHFIYSLYF